MTVHWFSLYYNYERNVPCSFFMISFNLLLVTECFWKPVQSSANRKSANSWASFRCRKSEKFLRCASPLILTLKCMCKKMRRHSYCRRFCLNVAFVCQPVGVRVRGPLSHLRAVRKRGGGEWWKRPRTVRLFRSPGEGGGGGGGFQLVMSKHSGRNSIELPISKIVTSFLAKGDSDSRVVTTVYNTLKQRERSPNSVL